ncbi:MAG TPA: 3-oxoadipate enol-lactonase [Burkholderiales bacterium]|nr:3-oxoadipate enol-lactonase [Burkholderiales bacterium]
MKVKTNGIETSYTIEGEGPWLTMSHSLGSDSSMWDGQAKLLSSRFKVLRYDTRGHGDSSAPKGPYTLEQLADDTKALFDALEIERTHWLGLSLGGMIGQTFAVKYPGVFQSMVLADTSSRQPPGAAQTWGDRVKLVREKGMEGVVDTTLARWLTEPFRKSNKDVTERVAAGIRATPVEGFAGCCEAIAALNVTDRLKDVDCPTLVIVGEEDQGTPPAAAKVIQENIRGAELMIIPAAAHLANINQPEAFNTALTSFYDRVA